MNEKSFERMMVEEEQGHWPDRYPPTNGYLVNALRTIGVELPRREKQDATWRKQALDLALENGLDFETTQPEEVTKHNDR